MLLYSINFVRLLFWKIVFAYVLEDRGVEIFFWKAAEAFNRFNSFSKVL